MSVILEFADKLRNQIDIVDVVGRHVELRRLGTNLKGLCPFHNEKTPSFTVSSSKQIFHCFGCHEGGDVIKFVQKIERLEWMDAVRHLSREFGIPMPELRAPSEHENETRDARAAALEATKFAMGLFCQTLTEKINANAEIKDYLDQRKLPAEVVKQFSLGLAPEGWSTLMDQAQHKGHSKEALLNAGLVIKHAVKDRIYDRFRNRLVFPIHDTHGHPIAFGARVYASNASPDEPKYINSPETVVYHKGQALYALHVAKDAIVREKKALLMEGYMDVIRAHSCGVDNAVASCGTALTDEQARALKRFCSEVVFIYDGDDAGQKAMLKGTEVLLQQGFSIFIVPLPDKHDPDSFLTENGAAAFNDLVSKAKNFFDHFLNLATRSYDLKTAEGKVQIVELMLPLLRRITNPIAKNDYVRRLADRLDVDSSLIQRQLAVNNGRSLDQLKETLSHITSAADGIIESTLLKLTVECPKARTYIFQYIDPSWLKSETVRKWFLLCRESQPDEICWEILMQNPEISDSESAFLRSLALQDEICDSSQQTIEHVATRLNRNYLRLICQITAREVDSFFTDGHPDELIDEHVRRANENVTPLRTLTAQYFKKNSTAPRRS